MKAHNVSKMEKVQPLCSVNVHKKFHDNKLDCDESFADTPNKVRGPTKT